MTGRRVDAVGGRVHSGRMAEPTTRPTDVPVTDFLAGVTPAVRREDGAGLAALMSEVTGVEPVMWGPSMIGYGSYHYRSPTNPRTHGDWPKVAFSPRTTSLVLYGIKDRPEAQQRLPSLAAPTARVPAASTSSAWPTSTRRCSASSSRSPSHAPTTTERRHPRRGDAARGGAAIRRRRG